MSDSTHSPLANAREKVASIVEGSKFSTFIIIVIAINAVTLGLETWPAAMERAGGLLYVIDRTALAIFVIEIALKLFAHGWRFFKVGWNVFDFAIVAVALMPASGNLSVLRALRILRAFRLISAVPKMRAVIEALLAAVPGMGSIVAVLILVFYIAAVMTTKLFGADFPAWFGSVGASMYSLFQIMTLESWSMGIVRPVMEQHPWAWAFFVPFIVVTSFAVLNLFIALIVNSMQTLHDEEERHIMEQAEKLAQRERELLMEELRALRTELADVKAMMQTHKTS